MSYPALMEKLDMGGPAGGADILTVKGGGGLTVETSGGKEGEVEERKGELLAKGEASEGGGGKLEVVIRGLLIAGREETGGRVVETGGLLTEMELVPGRDRGLDRPMVAGGQLTAAATVRGGAGLAGGVVSIPLSSIIFSAFYLYFSPQYDC